jgi:beta-aspartyl-peptidase (threonine type)
VISSAPSGPDDPPASAVRLQSMDLRPPVIAIHGGAGRRPPERSDELKRAESDGLRHALEAGWAVLDAGGPALEAAVAAVASMEDSGVFNAGRGAVPTTSGTVETDAAVMGVDADGTGAVREVSGAACAMTWPANPVHVALAVARRGDALLLAGPGADDFAAAAGLARRDPASLTGGGVAPISDMGTVGAVALDVDGHLAAATSTGGRRHQPPGRVGDTPVIGAGTWASEGGVAVSATGDGEAFIRAGFAHRIDQALGAGTALDRAASDALLAAARWGGTGGAIVLGHTGRLVLLYDTAGMAQGWCDRDGLTAEISGED